MKIKNLKILIIIGPPYSGKGTQCEILKNILGYEHISTGDRIRKEKENNTELGQTMIDYEDNGQLVPDLLMKNILIKILEENNQKEGLILDGYPRTKNQVDTFIELHKEIDITIENIVSIYVPEEELMNRVKIRAETSNRKDDKDINIIYRRIDIFESETRPAIEYIKTKFNVIEVNGLGSIQNVTDSILKEVNK